MEKAIGALGHHLLLERNTNTVKRVVEGGQKRIAQEKTPPLEAIQKRNG